MGADESNIVFADLKKKVGQLNEGLTTDFSGRRIFLLAENRVGKSWLLNFFLYATQVESDRYVKWSQDELEALQITTLDCEGVCRVTPHGFIADPHDAQNLRRALDGYLQSRPLRPGRDFRSFVLPSGNEDRSTTAVVNEVRFGKVWHILIEFDSVEDMCSKALDYLNDLRKSAGADGAQAPTDDDHEYNADRFKHIVDERYQPGLKDGTLVAMNPDDMEKYLKEDLLKRAGKVSS